MSNVELLIDWQVLFQTLSTAIQDGIEKGFKSRNTRLAAVEQERDRLKEKLVEAVEMVECLVQENPNEQIDDRGSTVLDKWRYDARAFLAKLEAHDE